MSLSYMKLNGKFENLISLTEDGNFKIWRNKLKYEFPHIENLPKNLSDEEKKEIEKLKIQYEHETNIRYEGDG